MRSIVIPAARTGRDRSRSTAVISTDQTNRGVWYCEMAGGFMLTAVVIKLIAPKIEEIPARWSEKIARSTEAPAWARLPASGGYTVQPVPTPASTVEDASRRRKDGGSSQKLMLFIRGNAMSGAPIISGTSQLPNPPIIIGITIKKIITKAWAVTTTLYTWSSPRSAPGWPSSARMRRLRAVPTIPAHAPKIRYRVPISLWLVENNHRLTNVTGKMAECKSVRL